MSHFPFGRNRSSVALVLAMNLLVLSACNSDQPTEAGGEPGPRPTSASVTCSDGCMVDNLTDVNGTLLVNHVPDGGSTPFSWVRYPFQSVASIQDNSVSGAVGSPWRYRTSANAGDWVELTVDVFGDLAAHPTMHDVMILLRTADGSNDGYVVQWMMCGRQGFCPGTTQNQGQWVAVTGDNMAGSEVEISTSTVSQGLHTFRAEINGSMMDITIDGGLVASLPLEKSVLPARSGMSLYAANDGSGDQTVGVRITSFAAAPPPCAPSGDPVLDSKVVRDALIAGLAASGPDLPYLQRKELGGVIWRLADGTYFVEDVPNLYTGARVTCAYYLGTAHGPPGGGTPVAVWHTHPHLPGDIAYNCLAGDPVSGAKPYVVNPLLNGRGSPKDWGSATPEYPVYVIHKLREIARLDYGVAEGDQKKNQNVWTIGNDSRACLTKKL
jgi:hypothetical protein